MSIFKKDQEKYLKYLKSDFLPLSILPNVSKIFEMCIYYQPVNNFDQIFSKHQFGFWTGSSA